MQDLFHQQYEVQTWESPKNHLLILLLRNEIMLAIDLMLVKMIMALAKALHNIFDISQSVPAKELTFWDMSNSCDFRL